MVVTGGMVGLRRTLTRRKRTNLLSFEPGVAELWSLLGKQGTFVFCISRAILCSRSGWVVLVGPFTSVSLRSCDCPPTFNV